MAAAAGSSLTISSLSLKQSQGVNRFSSMNTVAVSFNSRGFQALKAQVPRFRVACQAKPETVDKVCKIVRKQLALPEDSAVTGESKFAALGADSLDTVSTPIPMVHVVEIVMGLEEEFGISVEEESAQSIATVQDAADLIEKLIEKSA